MSPSMASSPPQEQPEVERPVHEWIEGLVEGICANKSRTWDDKLTDLLWNALNAAPPEAFMRPASTHSELAELIRTNPDLKITLEKTIKSRDYKGLLSLPILRADYQTISRSSKERELPRDVLDNIKATFEAFSAPYLSHFPIALLKTVDKYHLKPAYNKAISVVQASGMGKSRGMTEVAKSRFSFLFNLRQDTKHLAYPPPDATVRDYLVSREGNTFNRHTAFLCSLFEKAPNFITKVDRKRQGLALWWQKYLNEGEDELQLGTKRQEFYQEVVNAAEVMAHTKTSLLTAHLNNACKAFVEFIQGQYACDEPRSEPVVVCLLIFDEAHELTVIPRYEKSNARSNYHELGSVLAGIAKQPVFSVFLSTNSSIQSLAPPSRFYPSRHVSRGPNPATPYPPITELPFDTHAKDINGMLVERNLASLSAICSIPVMVCFGRALWHTLYEANYMSVIKLAMEKLNPTRNFFGDNDAMFACLAIRINLDFDATSESGQILEAKQVEYYMRIIFAVPEHREYMRTGTPSEPILAEAAALLLNMDPNKWPLDKRAPTFLLDAFMHGFLARGEREAMVGRLLWTLAHDKAVLDGELNRVVLSSEPDCDIDMETSDVYPARFHRPIRVLDFLHALFHEDHHDKIDNAKPIGDTAGQTLAVAFADAYISFSHFMEAGDCDIDFHNIYRLLLRGAALSCQQNQRFVDFLTPIHFGSPGKTTLRRSTTSVLQAQIKNSGEAENVFVDCSLVGTPLPVISLVHLLGTVTSSVDVAPSCQSDEESEGESLHYQIVSRGCSSKTFGVIPRSLDSTYPELLGSNLLDDFPRTGTDECLSLFRQQQPCTGIERPLNKQSKYKQSKAQKRGVGKEAIETWFGKDVK